MLAPREWTIRHLTSVTSTMDVVADAADQGADAGLVVVADEQTAGRGRGGRRWSADGGTALLCSLLLRAAPSFDASFLLSLGVGLAIARTVETLADSVVGLKWPNDVLVNDQKLAGVLMTSRQDPTGLRLIVGIGVNLLAAPAEYGAIALADAVRRPIERDEFLGGLLAEVSIQLRAIDRGNRAAVIDGWRRRAAGVGEFVRVRDGGDEVVGTFRGVDDRGALLLERNGALETIVAGDLVRGPRRVQRDDAS